jgi:hypothetical protein
MPQDAPDTAARIGHVAGIARDQVHMYVHARLPTGRSYVDADVIPIRRMALFYTARNSAQRSEAQAGLKQDHSHR